MSSNAVNPSFYADFSGLTALKKNVKADDPKAIREAARQFESLFTDMMLKSMRAAKLGDSLGESQESDFYQDMYDQQLSLQMSQGKGLGLADMLVQQLTRTGAARMGGATASGNGGTAAASPSTAASGGAAQATAGGSAATATPASHDKAGSVPVNRRVSFIQSIEPYAQHAAAQLGVSADSIIAQAALETGWGQHVPSGNEGGSSHNLFGIKAGSGWNGPAVNVQTTEYSQGAAASAPQAFRTYSSIQQGVNDYVSLLQRGPNYQQALGTGDDVAAFAGALQRGGYATDPNYVQKLAATAAAVKALRTADAPLKLAAALPMTRGRDSA